MHTIFQILFLMIMIESFDVELNRYIYHQEPSHAIKRIWLVACGLFVFGFCCEYYQEYNNISQLKALNVISEECKPTHEQPTWYWSMAKIYTGLGSSQERECHEQLRIASLLPIPNPLVVCMNLIWRAFVTENAGYALSTLLSQQSYIIQFGLIVGAVVILSLTIYSLIMKGPDFINTLVHKQQQPYNYNSAQFDIRYAPNMLTSEPTNWTQQRPQQLLLRNTKPKKTVKLLKQEDV